MVYAAEALTKKQVTTFRDNFRKAREKMNGQRWETLLVELNRGCSIGCRFCCYSSRKGIDRPMPFQLLETARGEMVKNKSPPYIMITQFRGDPFDYLSDGKDIRDICSLFNYEISNYVSTNVTTAVPVGSEARVRAAIDSGMGMRLTLSFMNEARLLADPWFRKLFKDMWIEKKRTVASFITVDDKTVGTLQSQIEGRKTTKSELFIWIEDRLEMVYGTKGIFKLCGDNIVHILGTDKGAYIHRVSRPAKGLQVITNQMQFSRMIAEGRLKQGDPFICEYWEDDRPKIGMERPYDLEIMRRNWNIHPWGRVYGKHFASEFDDHCGLAMDAMLITSDGAIWVMKNSKEMPEGIALERISPPL